MISFPYFNYFVYFEKSSVNSRSAIQIKVEPFVQQIAVFRFISLRFNAVQLSYGITKNILTMGNGNKKKLQKILKHNESTIQLYF